MDTSRNDLLGEIAADAALERSDFLVQATEQLRKFLDANKNRISELGGLVLIDEDPDYLSIAPDLTFRSRTRYLDELTGEWTSETEVIESAAELVELYNPADLYQAFADAAREAAGLDAEPTAEGDLLDAAGIGVDEGITDRRARSVRRGRRRVGGDPARARRGRRRRARGPAPVRPGPRVPGAEPAQRGAPPRAVRGRALGPDRQDRRPDRQRRRRRAAHAHRVRRVPGRGPHRGGQRVAAARDRRGARRVLRPDRRVRRPGRRARRGLSRRSRPRSRRSRPALRARRGRRVRRGRRRRGR